MRGRLLRFGIGLSMLLWSGGGGAGTLLVAKRAWRGTGMQLAWYLGRGRRRGAWKAAQFWIWADGVNAGWQEVDMLGQLLVRKVGGERGGGGNAEEYQPNGLPGFLWAYGTYCYGISKKRNGLPGFLWARGGGERW